MGVDLVKRYNYLLVGSGLYSAVFSYLATQEGKSCLVIEKRNHIGGNIYICVETVNIKSDYAIDLLLVCFIIIV